MLLSKFKSAINDIQMKLLCFSYLVYVHCTDTGTSLTFIVQWKIKTRRITPVMRVCILSERNQQHSYFVEIERPSMHSEQTGLAIGAENKLLLLL